MAEQTRIQENIPQNENPSICHICQNTKFQDSTSPTQDKYLLKPCACDFLVHHGCIVDQLVNQNKCLTCGVEYRFYVYGSKADFLVKYWYRFAIVASICLILLGFGIYGIYLSFPPTELFAVLILVPSWAAVIIAYHVGYHCMNGMFYEDFLKFQHRNLSVIVFNYNPEMNSPVPVDEEVIIVDDVDTSNLISLDMTTKQNQAEETLKTNGIMALTPYQTTEEPLRHLSMFV